MWALAAAVPAGGAAASVASAAEVRADIAHDVAAAAPVPVHHFVGCCSTAATSLLHCCLKVA